MYNGSKNIEKNTIRLSQIKHEYIGLYHSYSTKGAKIYGKQRTKKLRTKDS